VLGGGLTGLLSGIGLQEWVHQIAYPINIAGKPLNSWPQFVPVCFELTILFAALSAVHRDDLLNGLPQPYHPVFNVRASSTRAATSSSCWSSRTIRSSIAQGRWSS
jgi:hypothetical protein